MQPTRRHFLVTGTLASLGVHALGQAATPTTQATNPGAAGAVPTMGVLPAAGPEVTAQDFQVAERLMQVQMTPAQREEAAGNWRTSMAPLAERRTGPHTLLLSDTDVPATVWNPRLTGTGPRDAGNSRTGNSAPTALSVTLREPTAKPLPQSDADIAFSSIADQGRWIRAKQLTSERLTRISLERLGRYNPQLRCVITLTAEHALAQARRADADLAAGRDRGPLHGIPYGAKDLLDTAGIATTWGAEPFRNRVPQTDAAVIRVLNEAGAVLVAKLSLGALALNDVWFGGQTMNPWVPNEGASGSSAGPGSAVAAGLVGFAIGSETQGSILSPSMRCGVAGLRPTFGRVPRTGAMTLSWSCDKLGPMARTVEDTLLVLAVISDYDAGDLASTTASLTYDGSKASVRGLRIGYFPKWMNEAPATEVDRAAVDQLRKLGATMVSVTLPDWPYDSLNTILFAESAAAFEQITLDHRVDQLKMQTPEAWPNTFRQSRFLSAVDFVQADRLRRRVAAEMARLMETVDLLLVPTMRDEMMVIANFTGHPALCVRTGFISLAETRSDWLPGSMPTYKLSPPARVPYGVTLIGQLMGEGPLAEAGSVLERATGAFAERPAGFA